MLQFAMPIAILRLFKELSAMQKNWIVTDKDHLGGEPRVRGSRISVGLLLEFFACGMTIPEILKAYPSLTEEAIRGALQELSHSRILEEV